MSKLCGVWHHDLRPVSQQEAAQLASAFESPGYAGGQQYAEPGLLLGAAAESHSGQPRQLYPSSDGNCCAWDGRLDNQKELVVKTGLSEGWPNSALALAIYERNGASGLGALLGDWSICIWDARRRMIVLASDYAGIRPLYYHRHAGNLCWSSSVTEVACWTGATEIDDLYVGSLLLRGSAAGRTPYAGVFAVPPGHAVCVSEAGIATKAFWNLPVDRDIRYQDERCYEERLYELFREAVKVRLSGAGPTCAELSGGLDSSSVVCMADRLQTESPSRARGLNTFSYTHEGCADEKYFREVERLTDVSACHLELQSYPAVAADAAGGTPAWWVLRFRELARRMAGLSSDVFLTGQLGDLIMGNTNDDTDQVAESLARGGFSKAGREAYAWARSLRAPVYPILWRSLRQAYSSWVPPAAPQASVGAMRADTEDSLRAALRSLLACHERERSEDAPWRHAPPGRRRRFRAVYEMMQSRSLQAPEALQHISYAHPFAHRPLVEYMLSIPAHMVCRPNEPRRLMRRAFAGLLPPLILGRKSKAVYTSAYIGALVPLAATLLQSPAKIQLVERGYLDCESLTSRLQKFTQGLDCNEPQLRQVILLEFWLRNQAARGSFPQMEATAGSGAAGS